MSVIKTIDLVGVSTESWRDAASQALAEAAKTLRGIEGMDVLETSATVEGTLNPNGSSTMGYFQWGKSTAYGSSTSSRSTRASWPEE